MDHLIGIEQLEDRLMLSGNVFTSGADLVIQGTTAADTVQVSQAGSGLRVILNGFDHGTFASPTGSVEVLLGSGNDELNFQVGVTVDALVFAGPGDDLIRTGAGNDEIVAGAGNDVVFGREGRDRLIGSDGNDVLRGQGGNDQLVGCLLYTSPSPRDLSTSRMPSSA